MLNNQMLEAINIQINKELYSAYLYLSMAAYFEEKNLKGFAHWMNLQAKEEISHAMKMYDYIFERGGKVTLLAIDQPKDQWSSPLAVFEEAYSHEQKVTQMINGLYELAVQLKDYATQEFLQWFIAEQVEEESNASEIVEKLKFAGDGSALLFIDSQMGRREK